MQEEITFDKNDNFEAVLYGGDGKAIDFVDPVVSFTETKSEWIVRNPYHSYLFEKVDGHSMRIQKQQWPVLPRPKNQTEITL